MDAAAMCDGQEEYQVTHEYTNNPHHWPSHSEASSLWKLIIQGNYDNSNKRAKAFEILIL